jgi:hypothetical protein
MFAEVNTLLQEVMALELWKPFEQTYSGSC